MKTKAIAKKTPKAKPVKTKPELAPTNIDPVAFLKQSLADAKGEVVNFDESEVKAPAKGKKGKIETVKADEPTPEKSKLFVFDVRSYHAGKFHRAIAHGPEEAADLMADDVTSQKWPKHPDAKGFHSADHFRNYHRNLYLHQRGMKQVGEAPADQKKPVFVGRNLPPYGDAS